MKTKSIAFAAVFLFGFAACTSAPQSYYELFRAGKYLESFPYKTGATENSLSQDLTNCAVEATQKVPQHQVIRTKPTYTRSAQTQCNKIGTQTFCNTTGGGTVGGETYSEDANAGLRQRVFYQCMANKNYRYVNLPPCPEGVTLKVETNGLLPLSNTTCYRVYPNNQSEVGNY